MPGHFHSGDPSLTQNQGNSLGDRPCVRQSKICREQMGGNAMKDLMGQSDLKWQTDRQEGAYAGNRVHGQGSTSVAVPPPQQQQTYTRAGANRNQGGGVPWATDDNVSSFPPQQQQRQYQAPPQQQQQQQERAQVGVDSMRHRPGAGQANRTTYNIFTGQ